MTMSTAPELSRYNDVLHMCHDTRPGHARAKSVSTRLTSEPDVGHMPEAGSQVPGFILLVPPAIPACVQSLQPRQ